MDSSSNSLQELKQQYTNLHTKPQIGFATLWSNIQHLRQKRIFVNEILNASDHAFILRCTSREQIPSRQLIIKCFLVSTHATLSTAVELFQQQLEIARITRTIETYVHYLYNAEDEMLNLIRPNVYRCSIDHIFRMNAVSGIMNRFQVIYKWVEQLLGTVCLLHERGIIHGGIKPSNIFIDEATDEIRIVDIGFALRIAKLEYKSHERDIYSTQIAGTSTAMNSHAKAIPQFDVHSLMVIFYQMTFGFDNSFSVIKQLESGTPFDETEQDSNPNENEETEFKYMLIKLVNRVVCSRMKADYSIFFVSDIIHQKRTLEPLDHSPRHIAATLNNNFASSKQINAEPKSNSEGEVDQIDHMIESVENQPPCLQPYPSINQRCSPASPNLDQEDLFKQEILFQQMQAQQKREREIYSQKEIPLQDKIEIYKKADYTKYQLGVSAQNLSSAQLSQKSLPHPDHYNTTPPINIEDNSNNQQIYTNQLNMNPMPNQSTNPITSDFVIHDANQQPNQHQSTQKQTSVSFIGSTSHLNLPSSMDLPTIATPVNNDIFQQQQYSQSKQEQIDLTNSTPIAVRLEIPQLPNVNTEQKNQAQLSEQSLQQYLLEQELLYQQQKNHQQTNAFNDLDYMLSHSKQIFSQEIHHQSLPQIEHQPNQVATAEQSQNKQEQSGENEQCTFQDEWVLDFSNVKHVQRGDDQRQSDYIAQNMESQYASTAIETGSRAAAQRNASLHSMSQFQSNQPQPQTHTQVSEKSLKQEEIESSSRKVRTQSSFNQVSDHPNYIGPYSQSLTNIAPTESQQQEIQIQQCAEGILSNQINSISPGEVTLEYPSGKLMYIGTVDLATNKKHGQGRLFDESGVLVYVGGFSQDHFEGVGCEFYENGAKQREGIFTNGELHPEGRTFYKNGVVSYEGGFFEGQCHGEGAKFTERGALVSIGEYQKGKINGRFTRFHENRQVSFQGFSRNNKREGDAVEFHPNGVTSFEGTYSKGKKVSGIEYDESGFKTFEGIYENDEEE